MRLETVHGMENFPSLPALDSRFVPYRTALYRMYVQGTMLSRAALRCAATRLCRHEPSCVHAYCTPYMKVRVDFFGYGYIQVRYLRMYICAQGSAWGKIIG